LTSRESAKDIRKRQLRDKVNEYTNQVRISFSFEKYIESVKIGKLIPEPPIRRMNGLSSDGYPDLLFSSSSGKIILDIKAITSQSELTYRDRVEELKKYDGVISYDGESFEAELVALCPHHLVTKNEAPEGICTIGYDVEDGFITLGPIRNRPKNIEFRYLFEGDRLEIKIRYGPKFLRDVAPLSYTVEIVYNALLEASEFNLLRVDIKRTEMDALRSHLRSSYPARLKSKTGQLIHEISDGPIEKALEFLKKHEWIKRDKEFIEVMMDKGERSASLVDTFIQLQVNDEFEKYGDKIAEGIPDTPMTLDYFPQGSKSDKP
jgi:hypothetical protein